MNLFESIYNFYKMDQNDDSVHYKLQSDINSTIIKCKEYNTDNSAYTILNYDEQYICYDDSYNAIYRSVVFSHPEKELLCFSPPKSMSYDCFKALNYLPEEIHINEFIEGVMVNLFYDNRIKSWEIATKSAVGGIYPFFHTRSNVLSDKRTILSQHLHKKTNLSSFRDMFIDVFTQSRFLQKNTQSHSRHLNDIPGFEYFPKEYSYSFVLQHPKNKIIIPITEAKLYLVAVYRISDPMAISIPSNVFEKWDIFNDIRGIIDFPKTFDTDSYEDIEEKYISFLVDYPIAGVHFLNTATGCRSYIKNQNYESIKKYGKKNINIFYNFLCLKRIDKITDFLAYFPKYKKMFKDFNQQYNEFIHHIHDCYLIRYVYKKNVNICNNYAIHIYRLHHDVYIPSIHSKKKIIITKDIVNEYINKLEPSEIMYYLQYNRRLHSNP